MLRIQELVRVMALSHDVGQRQFGHFDHDAHQASGPNTADHVARDDQNMSASARNSDQPAKSGRPVYNVERTVNPQTGEKRTRLHVARDSTAV